MTTVPPIDRHFTSGNMNLHYLDWGNEGATPLLLLHHISSNAHTWDEFASRMRESYHVLALDMRGHGDSVTGQERGTIPPSITPMMWLLLLIVVVLKG